MKILICIFLVVIFTGLTSQLKINIRSLTKQKNLPKVQFHVNVGIYLLGFIKIFGISLQENGIQFLGFHFAYPSVKIDQESMKMFKKYSVRELFQSLNIKLNQFDFTMQVGTEDVMLTVFLVTVISGVLSVWSAKNAGNINLKNYHYQITPVYNENRLSFRGSSQISLTMFHFVKTIILLKKQKQGKQEKHFAGQSDLIKI